MQKTKATRLIEYLLIGIIIVLCCMAVFYTFFTYRKLINADVTGYLFFAKESFDMGTMFPKTFIYGNALPIIGWNSFASIYLLFTKDLFFIHQLVMITRLVILFFVLVFFSRVAKLSWLSTLIIISIFFTGISSWITRFVIGDGGYGYLLIVSLVILALNFKNANIIDEFVLNKVAYKKFTHQNRIKKYLYKLVWLFFIHPFIVIKEIVIEINKKNRKSFFVLLSSLSILFIFSCLCLIAGSTRMIIYIFFPLLLSFLIYNFFEHNLFLKNKSIYFIISTVLLTIIISLIIKYILMSCLGISDEVNYALLKPKLVSNSDLLFRNFKLLFSGYLLIFDIIHLYTLKSITGFYYYYRLILLIFLVLLPFLLIFRYKKISNKWFRYFIIFYLVNFFYISLSFVFGSVVTDILSARFVILNIFYSVILLGFCFDEFLIKKQRNLLCFLGVLALIPLYVSSYFYYVVPHGKLSFNNKTKKISFIKNSNRRHHVQNMLDFLIKDKIKYGYASYWWSGLITVLSNNQTQINAINLVNGLPVPNYLGASKRWYKADNYKGPTCLLLTWHEYNPSKNQLERFLGKGKIIYDDQSNVILQYNFNLAANKLFGWPNGLKSEKLQSNDFKAKIYCDTKKLSLKSGQQVELLIKIKNLSQIVFTGCSIYPINVGGHLLNENKDKMLNFDFCRSSINDKIKPGEEGFSKITFKAPKKGKYYLEIDLVQEKIAWFSQMSKKSDNIFKTILIEMDVSS